LKACEDIRYGKLKESDFGSLDNPALSELFASFTQALDRPEAMKLDRFGAMLARASDIVSLTKKILLPDLKGKTEYSQAARWHECLNKNLP